MADDPNEPEAEDAAIAGEEEAEARAFILARRAKFVAAALASAGIVTVACGGESKDGGNPQTCLTPMHTGGSNTGTGGAQVCLSPSTGGVNSTGGTANTGGFSPCLSILPSGGAGGFNPCLGMPASGGAGGEPVDAGDDAAPATGGTTGSGGMPLPCLVPPQNTGGVPTPCLSVPQAPEVDSKK